MTGFSVPTGHYPECRPRQPCDGRRVPGSCRASGRGGGDSQPARPAMAKPRRVAASSSGAASRGYHRAAGKSLACSSRMSSSRGGSREVFSTTAGLLKAGAADIVLVFDPSCPSGPRWAIFPLWRQVMGCFCVPRPGRSKRSCQFPFRISRLPRSIDATPAVLRSDRFRVHADVRSRLRRLGKRFRGRAARWIMDPSPVRRILASPPSRGGRRDPQRERRSFLHLSVG